MNLIESYLTNSGCYQAGKKIIVKGLMIHSVGCPQPKASVFINTWNQQQANACVHGIIEPGGAIYQTLPWNHRGWHCGSGKNGSGNNTYIGIEMTEPATIHYQGGSTWVDDNPANTKKHILSTYQHALELFAFLCKQYKLNPLTNGVILSHSEGYRRGISSNHGDVEHIWKYYGLTMTQFRQDIKEVMKEITSPVQEIKPLSGSLKVIYKGTDGLNVRNSPELGNNINQVVKEGSYTVIGISTDGKWYQLKSGLFITTGKQYVAFYEKN